MNPSKSHHCFPMCFSALLNLYNCPTLSFLSHTHKHKFIQSLQLITRSLMKLCLFCFVMQNKVVYTDGTIMKISAAVVFLAVHVVCSYLCWWSHISGHLSWDSLRSHPKNMVWGGVMAEYRQKLWSGKKWSLWLADHAANRIIPIYGVMFITGAQIFLNASNGWKLTD